MQLIPTATLLKHPSLNTTPIDSTIRVVDNIKAYLARKARHAKK